MWVNLKRDILELFAENGTQCYFDPREYTFFQRSDTKYAGLRYGDVFRAVAADRRKPIMDQHGNVYESTKAAARVLGIDGRSIRRVLKGTRRHCRGLEFRYGT
jgi:hypothetical protein